MASSSSSSTSPIGGSTPPIPGTSVSSPIDFHPVSAWRDLSYKANSGHPKISTKEALQQIVQEINERVAHLDLSGHGMGNELALFLATLLRFNRTLVSIDLSGNGMNQDDVDKFYEILFSQNDSKLKGYVTSGTPPNTSLCYITIDGLVHRKKLLKYSENTNNAIAVIAYCLLRLPNPLTRINTSSPKEITEPKDLKETIEIMSTLVQKTGLNPFLFLPSKLLSSRSVSELRVTVPYGYITGALKPFSGAPKRTFCITESSISIIKSDKQILSKDITYITNDRFTIFDKPLFHLVTSLGLFAINQPIYPFSTHIAIDTLDHSDLTSLFYAVKQGNVEAVSNLIKAGANPFYRGDADLNYQGEDRDQLRNAAPGAKGSPIAQAVQDQHIPILTFLLYETLLGEKYNLRNYDELNVLNRLIVQAFSAWYRHREDGTLQIKDNQSWIKNYDLKKSVLIALFEFKTHYPLARLASGPCGDELHHLIRYWSAFLRYNEKELTIVLNKTTAVFLSYMGQLSPKDFTEAINKSHSDYTQNSYGSTPLLIASSKNNMAAVQLLLRYPEVNINAPKPSRIKLSGIKTTRDEEKGFTSLHYAVRNRNPDMVRLLLEKGANRNIRDGYRPPKYIVDPHPDGRTPLNLAEALRYKHLGNDKEFSDQKGFDPFQELDDEAEQDNIWKEIIFLLEHYYQNGKYGPVFPVETATSSSSSPPPSIENKLDSYLSKLSEGSNRKDALDLLSWGEPLGEPTLQTLTQRAIEANDGELLQAAVSSGANINTLNIGGQTLFDYSIALPSENTNQIVPILGSNDLMIHGFNSEKGRQVIEKISPGQQAVIEGLIQHVCSLDARLIQQSQEVSALEKEVSVISEVNIERDHLIRQLSQLVHLEEANKLDTFLGDKNPNSEFFRCFHHTFSYQMNVMLNGMRLAQSPHIQSTAPASVNAVGLLKAIAKEASTFPGAKLVIKTAEKMLNYFPKKWHDARLKRVAELFDSGIESDLFTLMLSCHLMGMLRELLPLMDQFKSDSQHGFLLHEAAIERLAFNLTIRILDYMFEEHLKGWSDENKWSLKRENSLRKYCEQVALSICWYEPAGWRDIETLGANPALIDRIIKLPYDGDESNWKKFKLGLSNVPKKTSRGVKKRIVGIGKEIKQAASSVKQGATNTFDYLSSLVREAEIEEETILNTLVPSPAAPSQPSHIKPEANIVCLTGTGCFQEAVIMYEGLEDQGVYYKPKGNFRPEKYPPLTLTRANVNFLQQITLQEKGSCFFEMHFKYSQRELLTRSWRQIIEELNGPQSTSFQASGTTLGSSRSVPTLALDHGQTLITGNGSTSSAPPPLSSLRKDPQGPIIEEPEEEPPRVLTPTRPLPIIDPAEFRQMQVEMAELRQELQKMREGQTFSPHQNEAILQAVRSQMPDWLRVSLIEEEIFNLKRSSRQADESKPSFKDRVSRQQTIIMARIDEMVRDSEALRGLLSRVVEELLQSKSGPASSTE